MLLGISNDGRVHKLSTHSSQWAIIPFDPSPSFKFKNICAIPNHAWAVANDRQVYVLVHDLDTPIRVKEETYENERRAGGFIGSFGQRLLPTDRPNWSTKDGLTERKLEDITLPSSAWQWETQWEIDTTLDGQRLDSDGWTYAVDFPTTYYPTVSWNNTVRRRKWVRYRRYAYQDMWCVVSPNPQEAISQVSVGGQNQSRNENGELSVWAVTVYGSVVARVGVTRTNPEGNYWIAAPFEHPMNVKHVCCGPTGVVWAVMWDGTVVYRVGISAGCPAGLDWIHVDCNPKKINFEEISVGTSALAGISEDGQLWLHTNVNVGYKTGERPLVTWLPIRFNALHVSVSLDDHIWVVDNADRSIYFKHLKDAIAAKDQNWKRLQCSPLRDIVQLEGSGVGARKLDDSSVSEGSEKFIDSLICEGLDEKLNLRDKKVENVALFSWKYVAAGGARINLANPPEWYFENLAEYESWNGSLASSSPADNVENNDVNESCSCKCLLPGCEVQRCRFEVKLIRSNNCCGSFKIIFDDNDNYKPVELNAIKLSYLTESHDATNHVLTFHTLEYSNIDVYFAKLYFSHESDLKRWKSRVEMVAELVNGGGRSFSEDSLFATTESGNIYTFDPAAMRKRQSIGGGKYCVKSNVDADQSCSLSNGFSPSSEITIHGFIPKNADHFSIDLIREEPTFCRVLHVDVRFKDAVIVRNTYEGQSWGKEERDGPFDLQTDTDFTVVIRCSADYFEIFINGVPFRNYAHRVTPDDISLVKLNGSVKCESLLYESSKPFTVMDEMYWKQIDGHLAYAKATKNIVWGIGEDGILWSMTAEGRQNEMTNSRDFFIYENQRWYPLKGYCDTLLPTDRHNWTNESGRINLDKENVALPDDRWKWICDWKVDFHTPGGVDNEGWQYAIDFPASYHPDSRVIDTVRRRRWVRTATLVTTGPWQRIANTKVHNVILYQCGYEIQAWAISDLGALIYRVGVTPENPCGDEWDFVLTEESAVHVSYGGCVPTVWICGASGAVYSKCNKGWKLFCSPATGSPKIRSIYIGDEVIWALDESGLCYVQRLTTDCESDKWLKVASEAKEHKFKEMAIRIDENGDNDVWAITASGVVCRRVGITKNVIIGGHWEYGLPAKFTSISAVL